jgi:hypothetical protein
MAEKKKFLVREDGGKWFPVPGEHIDVFAARGADEAAWHADVLSRGETVNVWYHLVSDKDGVYLFQPMGDGRGPDVEYKEA